MGRSRRRKARKGSRRKRRRKGGGGDNGGGSDGGDDDDDGVTHRLTVGCWTNGTQLATHRLDINAVFYVKTKSWF